MNVLSANWHEECFWVNENVLKLDYMDSHTFHKSSKNYWTKAWIQMNLFYTHYTTIKLFKTCEFSELESWVLKGNKYVIKDLFFKNPQNCKLKKMTTYELVLSHSKNTLNQLGRERILRKQLSLYFWVSISRDFLLGSLREERKILRGIFSLHRMSGWKRSNGPLKSLVGLAKCSLLKENEVICVFSS